MWLVVAACAGKRPLHTTPAPPPMSLCASTACADTLRLTFLGVGGFLFERGERSLLTAPSFTNPGLLHVAFGLRVRSDSALVARRLALVDSAALARASAILVGHGHYDHLLDVPLVARRHAPRATVYGGRTVANILAGAALDSSRVRMIVRDDLGDPTRVGRWFHVPGYRFMALESEHPPNVAGVTFAPGRVWTPLRGLPRAAHDYKLGEPYAYLIDVLRADSTPALRILYHDAAASPDLAHLPPFAGPDVRPVDLLIVTAGNFDAVPDYPSAHLRTLQPKLTIVAHWEDFFRSAERPLRAIPLLRSDVLAKRLEQHAPGRWITPEPMATLTIAY
ncbi:MAG TPA: MBL fold metallo-hydrolase [Gemmatimonadaceae bacterium]|nr:MBL fold metallo-hydrolase [Gemmatimonadaceae bacterium]